MVCERLEVIRVMEFLFLLLDTRLRVKILVLDTKILLSKRLLAIKRPKLFQQESKVLNKCQALEGIKQALVEILNGAKF